MGVLTAGEGVVVVAGAGVVALSEGLIACVCVLAALQPVKKTPISNRETIVRTRVLKVRRYLMYIR